MYKNNIQNNFLNSSQHMWKMRRCFELFKYYEENVDSNLN